MRGGLMPVLVLTHMDEDNKTDDVIKKEFEFTGAETYYDYLL
jgi:hypothetical protein